MRAVPYVLKCHVSVHWHRFFRNFVLKNIHNSVARNDYGTFFPLFFFLLFPFFKLIYGILHEAMTMSCQVVHLKYSQNWWIHPKWLEIDDLNFELNWNKADSQNSRCHRNTASMHMSNEVKFSISKCNGIFEQLLFIYLCSLSHAMH